VTPRGALRAGTALGPRYEVIGHLARSNVLDVYDAWSRERGCRVIAKTLRPDRLDDSRAERALVAEGRLLARLDHPHIVRAYETLRDPRAAVVLETLSGETLTHLIDRRERRLSAAEIGFLGIHLCSAVRYLHAREILHLDVKPSNVVSDGGRARLIDLSVARPPGPAKAGIGTWCYMAPEQARGGRLGPEADVWGIGGVLFEAATGECAFDEDGDDDVEYPQLLRRATPVQRVRQRLPVELAVAIDACLAPSPVDRPTLTHLAAACESAAGLPPPERLLSRNAASASRVVHSARSHRAGVAWG
jgi:serine/threonine protein kinase